MALGDEPSLSCGDVVYCELLHAVIVLVAGVVLPCTARRVRSEVSSARVHHLRREPEESPIVGVVASGMDEIGGRRQTVLLHGTAQRNESIPVSECRHRALQLVNVEDKIWKRC